VVTCLLTECGEADYGCSMLGPILPAVGRLVFFTALGFFLFRAEPLRRRVLPPFIAVTINVLFPLYFIHDLSRNWEAAADAGWGWMLGSFFACVVMVGLQGLIGKCLTIYTKGLASDQPREMVALFALHNAGYIPIPIMRALASGPILVYVFIYTLAFNAVFWTVAVGYFRQGSRSFIFRPNMPMVGLALGLVIAATDLYRFVPDGTVQVLDSAVPVALDLVLVVLGGILASIPREDLKYRSEFGRLVFWKMLIYPAVVLAALWLAPIAGLPGELAYALPPALVIQAAAPPATNIMIVARAYGSEEQVHFAGSAIIVTYVAAILTLPLFMAASVAAFSA